MEEHLPPLQQTSSPISKDSPCSVSGVPSFFARDSAKWLEAECSLHSLWQLELEVFAGREMDKGDDML